MNEFAKAKNYLSKMTKKGVGVAYKKLRQAGGTTFPMRGRYGYRGNWAHSLGGRVDNIIYKIKKNVQKKNKTLFLFFTYNVLLFDQSFFRDRSYGAGNIILSIDSNGKLRNVVINSRITNV